MGYAKKSEDNLSLSIFVRNTTTQPVEIKGFTSGDKFWPAIDYVADDRVDEFNENVLLFGQGNGSRQTEKDKEFLPFNASTDPIMVQVRFLRSSDNYINCDSHDEHSFDPMLLLYPSYTFNRIHFLLFWKKMKLCGYLPVVMFVKTTCI